MRSNQPKPPPSRHPGKTAHVHTEALVQSIHSNINVAREQVERSQKIVAQSRGLIARVKHSLARSQSIQYAMQGPLNPPIRPH
jgi:hypothetical protein